MPTIDEAIREFLRVAAHELRNLGRQGSQTEIAAIVGAMPQQITDAKAGRRGSWDTLIAWLTAWNAHDELPKLRLTVDRSGAQVVV